MGHIIPMEDYEVIEKALDKAYRHWKFWEKPVIGRYHVI